MKSLLWLMILVAMSGCSHNVEKSAPSVMESKLPYLFDEDGRIRDWLITEVVVHGSVVEVLEGILNASRLSLPDNQVSLVVGVRNTQSDGASSGKWFGLEDLLGVGNLVEAPLDQYYWLRERDQYFSHIVCQIMREYGFAYSLSYNGDAGSEIEIQLAPPEMLFMGWARATYLIPIVAPQDFEIFGDRLSPAGVSIAYDEDSRLLTVIDQEGGALFKMMHVMGYSPDAIRCMPFDMIDRTSDNYAEIVMILIGEKSKEWGQKR